MTEFRGAKTDRQPARPQRLNPGHITKREEEEEEEEEAQLFDPFILPSFGRNLVCGGGRPHARARAVVRK